jgi:GNAT superfamily N-acetyltransferase
MAWGCEKLAGVNASQPPVPRVASRADASDIARLLDAFNREYHEPTPGPEVLERRLGRLLASEVVIAILADDPPAGVALLTLRPNVWYDGPVALLDELYVVPDMRRRGYGSALLAATEAAARERGAELLEINVDAEDIDARRFYERHGYACMGPGESEPDLYYWRDLP